MNGYNTLVDQIIEHGPVESHDEVPRWFESLTAAGINRLRDELIEGRKLRAAAEARKRFKIFVAPYRSGGKVVLGIEHYGCSRKWWDEVQDFADLAELVRRADEHSEECGR